MPVKWRICEARGYYPEAREGGTLTSIAIQKEGSKIEEERAYLFGGLSRDLHCSVAYFTFNATKCMNIIIKEIARVNWVIENHGDPLKKRYGHATAMWENKLVIVGGSKMYCKETKRRECLSDIILYNPSNEEWVTIRADGAAFTPRRHHAACVVGRHLVVYGGMDGSQSYLSDLLAINLLVKPSEKLKENINPYRWTLLSPKGEGPSALACHSCELILHPDRLNTQFSLTYFPEIRGFKQRVIFIIKMD